MRCSGAFVAQTRGCTTASSGVLEQLTGGYHSRSLRSLCTMGIHSERNIFPAILVLALYCTLFTLIHDYCPMFIRVQVATPGDYLRSFVNQSVPQ